MYFNLTRQRLFTSACVVKPVRNVGHWPYMEGGLIMLWLNLQNQDSTLKFKIENFHIHKTSFDPKRYGKTCLLDRRATGNCYYKNVAR